MSTASISVQQGDKIKTIYVHGDGDIQSLGAILIKHYNNQDRADALVSLGDASSIYASIECPTGHSYKHPVPGHSVFYGRDRGESDTQACIFDSWQEFSTYEEWQGYNYLFDGSRWLCDSGNGLTILDNKLCGIVKQNSLDTLIEQLEFYTNAITDLAIEHLKNDGLTESESQLLCILNRLHGLCHAINGITKSDLKGNSQDCKGLTDSIAD